MKRALFILFLTFRSCQRCKKSVQKEKIQSRERNVCVRQTCFSAMFVLNNIMAQIFQIIHIWNKTLNPCINGGLEQRRKVQTVKNLFDIL